MFIRLCSRRGRDAQFEGTYLIFTQSQDVAWETAEQVKMDELESDQPETILRVLKSLYRYDEDVELPTRCEQFFLEFSRLPN